MKTKEEEEPTGGEDEDCGSERHHRLLFGVLLYGGDALHGEHAEDHGDEGEEAGEAHESSH